MKRTRYPIHRDFKRWAHMNPPLNRAAVPVMQALLGLLFGREKSNGALSVERKTIPVDGGEIRALWYSPKDLGPGAPCLVYCHGGGYVLPAAVCLMAEERGRPIPCGQMLLYPVTGAGKEVESMRKYTDTPMCNTRDMEKYDRMYMRDPSAGKRVYAAPIEAESLSAMPPAYVETAQFDCLRDGGILFARRLEAEGVPVELHNTEGTIHGFDIELGSSIVRECVERRIAFLRRVFAKG